MGRYAVKVLNGNYKLRASTIDKEVMNLRRFFSRDHQERLIRLLFTFELRGHFHMIFPCADVDLGQFWQRRFPEAKTPVRGDALARWLAHEMLGIAQGLHMIHLAIGTGPEAKDYGRHGDIKPENILWFPNRDQGQHTVFPTGVLKISDFGLTDFHSKYSKSNVEVVKTGWTDTYRAPECDVRRCLAQSYDFWSLGCVLLQFVTWYVEGWRGVSKFGKERAKASPQRMIGPALVRVDTFFNLDDDSGDGAVVNKAVINVRLLPLTRRVCRLTCTNSRSKLAIFARMRNAETSFLISCI